MTVAGRLVEIQDASGGGSVPDPGRIRSWVMHALPREASGEVTVRVVAEAEGARLNEGYRHGRGATNVLAFPADATTPTEADELPPLGDLVICAPVLEREANDRGSGLEAHWAHVVIHGVLHLVGFDHETSEDAAVMEARETELLATLGYPDPYQPV